MRIHVEGTVRDSFKHEFHCGSYGPWSGRRPWQKVLGKISDKYLTYGQMTGADTTPYNAVEGLALSIPAPVPSLNSVTGAASGLRPEIRDCQWWLEQLINQLIERQVLHADALKILEENPEQYC
ncbi:hypothetical protein BU23DRAFT_280215 [Bimuria novae-zelandiae CBS 107.79]|uniref:Uncharacterized protein n=1 Tax=Bimuria novae-zelandiae CBS 107.79 TaxID=1447943 RepID=A0A6A5USL2_9PLEO|nr:hypothetical protein BU23DRAFT_280215 [Bimuria novae-zelandiae CBS 107.79]